MNYDAGNTIPLRVTFTDPVTGQLFDPDTVVIEVIRFNDTTVLTPAVTHDGLGKYHADQFLDYAHAGGDWVWRTTTTNPSMAGERTFYVNPTKFTS